MKKYPALLAACILMLCLLTGCSPALPAGMDAQQLEERATTVVEAMNSREYETLAGMMRPDLQGQADAAQWAAQIDPVLDAAGPLQEITGAEAAGQKEGSYGTVAVVVVQCRYQNATKSYAVFFDTNAEVTGLRIAS